MSCTIALTAEQRALYTARLAAAEEAYHSVMLGGQAKVYVDQNGERIEYGVTNASRLAAYIAELKRLLGIGCGGPLNIWF